MLNVCSADICQPLKCASPMLTCHSDDEEDEEEVVQSESGFGNVIVVDNLPVVESGKYDKLRVVLQKFFSQIGSIREGGLFLPQDEDGKTKGYAFVEFSTPAVRETERHTSVCQVLVLYEGSGQEEVLCSVSNPRHLPYEDTSRSVSEFSTSR